MLDYFLLSFFSFFCLREVHTHRYTNVYIDVYINICIYIHIYLYMRGERESATKYGEKSKWVRLVKKRVMTMSSEYC